MTAPGIGTAWPGGRTLSTLEANTVLDMDTVFAQRQASFRFDLTNAVTGEVLGEIDPIRNATLTHDTGRTIKRQLSINLGRADTAAINPTTDRISPYMVFPSLAGLANGGAFPLGKYMWSDESNQVSTGGDISGSQLADEMFLVDQAILRGITGVGFNVIEVAQAILQGLPVEFEFQPTPYVSADAWGVGSYRGQMLEALSVAGDYWSPWFDNNGKLRFLRTFDPATQVPDIDLDAGARVIRNTILDTNDLLTAPNTFMVISNAAADPSLPVVGLATVPPTAPNSVVNRGFAITQVLNLQLSDAGQAQAVAEGLVQRAAIFATTTLSTPPDPRHDGYNVIRWQGVNWLELAWSMRLVEGAPMTHTMRRAYAA